MMFFVSFPRFHSNYSTNKIRKDLINSKGMCFLYTKEPILEKLETISFCTILFLVIPKYNEKENFRGAFC